MHVPFRHRLSVVQTRNFVLIAFILGCISIGVQIQADLIQARRESSSTIQQILQLQQKATSHAAWNYNRQLAADVLADLFNYTPILEATITSDLDVILAHRERATVGFTNLDWLGHKVLETTEFQSQLYVQGKKDAVGTLTIRIDSNLIAKPFFDRTIRNILSTTIPLIILAVVLVLVFYYKITKPLFHLSSRLTEVDTENPMHSPMEIPAGHTSDELGLVVSTTNNLLSKFDQLLIRHRATELKLRATQKKYRAIFDNAIEGFYQTTPDGRFVTANSAMAHNIGYDTPEEMISDITDISQQLYVDNRDREIFLEILQENGFVAGFETRFHRRDGTVIWVSEHARIVRDSEGGIRYIEGTASDITHVKEAEEELKRYREHLEDLVEKRTVQLEDAVTNLSLARDAADAANRAKSMFLANMSHEIRTPMNAVLGFAQLLARDPSLSPQAHSKVTTIMKSGDHLLSIINEILEMSRIEAGKVEVHTESIDLHGLLDDIGVMFHMRAIEKGLLFTQESAPDLPRYIITDLSKVRQIMINLLGNAVKFTKVGSVSMRAFSAENDRIAIEILDTGIGITSEEQEKLFLPFERTRSGEQTAGGTGLGLAISRKYAHLFGGEISVKSQPGKGSCFRFEFFAPSTTTVPMSEETPHRVTAIHPGQGDFRVLVVDDQSINRDLLRQMLEPLGFLIDEASDGQEAIEKVKQLKPHIILMDLVMPGMGGGEATRILRHTYTQESLTIIGITASAFGVEKQAFIDSGIDAYIAKPFQIQELYDVLAHHANIVFETEENAELSITQKNIKMPVLEKMSPEWCTSFRAALTRKSITNIRKLGEEAQGIDPLLSSWILERVALYDLNGLSKLTEGNESGANHG
ncbi:MAG: response regulator [Proteobacteria bacterium]|nr:response regulator [Pseudomonadota bacterium]